MKLVFVHGFLGQPEDWLPITNKLSLNAHYEYFNLWDLVSRLSSETLDLKMCAKKFCEHFGDEKIIAVGYSLGGRLLTEAYFQRPEQFDKLFLISSQPFKMPEQELVARKAWDKKWADKWRHSSWGEAVRQWNELSVFKNSKELPKRHMADFSSELLAQALIELSPVTQTRTVEDLNPLNPNNIYWLYGQLDQKYSEIYKGFIEKNKNWNIEELSRAGHRAPWDEPLGFCHWLEGKLRS